jgi:hypothetical protein
MKMSDTKLVSVLVAIAAKIAESVPNETPPPLRANNYLSQYLSLGSCGLPVRSRSTVMRNPRLLMSS